MINKVNVSSFSDLVSVIRKEIEDGRVILERNVDNHKTIVMWRIGSYIQTHILEHFNKADYGDFVFKKLSEEFNMGKRTLYRTVQFYKEYPNSVSPVTLLSWTHYVILLSVNDKVKRSEYEKIVLKEKLSKRQLLELLRNDKLQLSSETPDEPELIRGRPGVYRIKEIGGIFKLDCGFYTYFNRPELTSIKNPESYIEYTDSSSYKFIDPDKSLLYTFKAKIAEVVDGDTVKALLDLGFGIMTLQTLRLRGINAKDLHTEEGFKAKEYIESKILNLPFVVIKTYSRDIYLRYLTDVFYTPKNVDVYAVARKGMHLNQELIDKGFAERYWK